MNVKLVKAALYTYLILAFAYVLYGAITGTGLAGWLMDWQMQTFGSAYMKLTVFGAIAILYIPAFIAQKVIERVTGVRIPLSAREHYASGAAQDGATQTQSLRRSFVIVLILSVLPTLIAVPAYFYLRYTNARDQQSEIAEINLNNDAAPASLASARFVRLIASIQDDRTYTVEEGSTSSSRRQYFYTPLTGANWNAQESVRVFLASTSSGGATRLVRPRPPRTMTGKNTNESEQPGDYFEGRLVAGNLPTYALNEFARHGIRPAEPYYMLEPLSFINNRVPDMAAGQQYNLIPVFGIALSAVILFGGGIGLLSRKRAARRAQPAGNDS